MTNQDHTIEIDTWDNDFDLPEGLVRCQVITDDNVIAVYTGSPSAVLTNVTKNHHPHHICAAENILLYI